MAPVWRLWGRDQGGVRSAYREGQELRAICTARRLHPERDQFGKGDRQEKPRRFQRHGGDRHAAASPAEDLDTVGLEWLLVAQSSRPRP